MGKLSGKVTVITGASRGIGAGIATAYAQHGSKLALIDISPELDTFVKELQDKGYEVAAYKADVTKQDELKAVAAQVVEKYGTVDVLCCNAGVCRLGNFLELTEADRDFHININIKGVWNTAQAFLPIMLENGGGNIVITSSVTGDLVADPGETAYALSKAALVGFTKSLAVEFAQQNIRVNAIQPGYVLTPMADSIARQSNPDDPESVLTEMAKAIPMRRLAQPIEIGELAAFLGCDESSYLTGTCNVIDGGSTLPESVSVGV